MNQKGSILVVDDEVSIREACKKILLKEGFQVQVAHDGLEAKKIIQKENFDLVLIDLKLPNISGEELLRWLSEYDSDIVPVVITGYPSFDSAVSTVKEGAYDYIPKPFTSGELRRIVRRGLEKRWLVQEMRRLREEQERSLELVSQEQTKLKVIINSMVDGMLVVNNQGRLVLYNISARRMLNLHDALLEKSFKEVLRNDDLVTMISTLLTEKRSVAFSQEIKIEEKDYLVNLAPVNDNGNILGVVLSFRDVTKLRELSDMKSAFLNMVSHELRSPLGIVEGYLDIILLGMVKDEGQAKNMMERAKLRIKTLRQLTDDLLSLARMESERVKKELAPVNLQDFMKEVIELYQDKAMSKNIKINLHVEDFPVLRIDKNDLNLLCANLIDNAIKYNRMDGNVDIYAKSEGFDLCLRVKDEGIGIPQEALKNIFDEFYRVKNEKTRMITGTGLGLAIVQRIVKAYQGKIEVTSEEGKGSMFSVYLPIDNLSRGLEK